MISAVSWHGFPAWRLHDDVLEVDVVPALGAKIAGLRCRGREWLLQPSRPIRPDAPRVVYEEAELCGWDEMFPTIIGEGLPDHGEVWSRRWSAEVDGERLVCSVECTSVPVRFTRSATVEEGALVLRYEARNLSALPVKVLWAAHPQLPVTPSARLRAGAVGWVLVAGDARDVAPDAGRVLDGMVPGGSAKWWSAPGDRPHRVEVDDSPGALSIAWSGEAVRYLGIWVDHGAVAPLPVVSVQPATGWHDDLRAAVARGTALSLPPESAVSWELTVSCGPSLVDR